MTSSRASAARAGLTTPGGAAARVLRGDLLRTLNRGPPSARRKHAKGDLMYEPRNARPAPCGQHAYHHRMPSALSQVEL